MTAREAAEVEMEVNGVEKLDGIKVM